MTTDDTAAAELRTALGLHQQGNIAEAERGYQRVLSHHPKNVQALHHLGVLRCQQSRFTEGAELIRTALEIDPRSVDAHFNLALAWCRLGRNADAINALDRVLALQGRHIGAHFERALLLAKLGRPQQALAAFDLLLSLDPDHREGHIARGVVLGQLERHEEALAEFDVALQRAPGNSQALRYRGIALARLGRAAEALGVHDAVLARHPDDAETWHSRAIALNKLGRFEEAIGSCDRALRLRPDFSQASATRGLCLSGLRRDIEAVAAFDRALALNPRDAVAHYNRGNALGRLRQNDDAIASYDRALDINPDYPEALYNRGNLLRMTDRPEAAIVSYERALALRPDHPYAFGNLAHCRLSVCEWDALPELAQAVKARIRDGRSIISPFVALALTDDAELQRRCADSFVRDRVVAAALPPIDLARYQSKKLRLAYVSADFRSHPVGGLIPELIERHDRDRFEVIGISIGPDDGSRERARLVAAFDRFLDLQSVDEGDAAKLMRQMGIHIAVDLTGHTEHARPQILAHRPAPVQMQYLGYPGPSGAPYIDYVIADAVVVPPEHDRFYGEKIIRLPDSYFVSDSKKAISDKIPSRAETGLPEHGLVFCCFNATYKITPRMFGIWMGLLRAVDDSVLWLLAPSAVTVATFRQEAERHGVNSERIIFAERLPRLADHLARHALADLFLDTLPFNAHTTACEALWAGLPVVTCRGTTFAGRVGASLLNALGLPELVTEDLQAYEALALELARNHGARHDLRHKLRQRRRSAALFDTPRLAGHLEEAYQASWNLYRSGRPAENIEVRSREASSHPSSPRVSD